MTTQENIQRLYTEQSANLDRIEAIEEELACFDTTTDAQVDALIQGKPVGKDRDAQYALQQESAGLRERNNLIDKALVKLHQQQHEADHRRDVERVRAAIPEYGKRMTKTLRAFIDARKVADAAREVFDSVQDVDPLIRGRFQCLSIPGGWHATDIKTRESSICHIIREGVRDGLLDPSDFTDVNFDFTPPKNSMWHPSNGERIPAGTRVASGSIPLVQQH